MPIHGEIVPNSHQPAQQQRLTRTMMGHIDTPLDAGVHSLSSPGKSCIHMIWWQGWSHAPAYALRCLREWKAAHEHTPMNVIPWDEEMFVTEALPSLVDRCPSISSALTSRLTIVEQVDLARWGILLLFGGMYVDADTRCVRSAETLIRTLPRTLCLFGEPDGTVNNAVIVARDTIVHDFSSDSSSESSELGLKSEVSKSSSAVLIQQLLTALCHRSLHDTSGKPSWSTGPLAVRDILQSLPSLRQGIHVCTDTLFFSAWDWHHRASFADSARENKSITSEEVQTKSTWELQMLLPPCAVGLHLARGAWRAHTSRNVHNDRAIQMTDADLRYGLGENHAKGLEYLSYPYGVYSNAYGMSMGQTHAGYSSSFASNSPYFDVDSRDTLNSIYGFRNGGHTYGAYGPMFTSTSAGSDSRWHWLEYPAWASSFGQGGLRWITPTHIAHDVEAAVAGDSQPVNADDANVRLKRMCVVWSPAWDSVELVPNGPYARGMLRVIWQEKSYHILLMHLVEAKKDSSSDENGIDPSPEYTRNPAWPGTDSLDVSDPGLCVVAHKFTGYGLGRIISPSP